MQKDSVLLFIGIVKSTGTKWNDIIPVFLNRYSIPVPIPRTGMQPYLKGNMYLCVAFIESSKKLLRVEYILTRGKIIYKHKVKFQHTTSVQSWKVCAKTNLRHRCDVTIARRSLVWSDDLLHAAASLLRTFQSWQGHSLSVELAWHYACKYFCL